MAAQFSHLLTVLRMTRWTLASWCSVTNKELLCTLVLVCVLSWVRTRSEALCMRHGTLIRPLSNATYRVESVSGEWSRAWWISCSVRAAALGSLDTKRLHGGGKSQNQLTGNSAMAGRPFRNVNRIPNGVDRPTRLDLFISSLVHPLSDRRVRLGWVRLG